MSRSAARSAATETTVRRHDHAAPTKLRIGYCKLPPTLFHRLPLIQPRTISTLILDRIIPTYS